MRTILVLLAIATFSWYWFKGDLQGNSSIAAVDDMGDPIVLVFTVDKCQGYCQEVIEALDARQVPFEELTINPGNSDDENVILWKKMGQGSFPYIVSGNEKVIGTSRAQLATLLGENFGETYLTETENRYFSEHFYADGSPKIVMYGADWCPYCAKLRNEFNHENIDFVEIDVEKSGEKEMMSNVMEINGYPATWVGYTRVNGTTLRDVKKYLNKG